MVHGTYGATLQVKVGEEGAQRKPVGLANLTFDRWCVWVGGCKSYVLAGIANFWHCRRNVLMEANRMIDVFEFCSSITASTINSLSVALRLRVTMFLFP
jgi:hypothetical protein